MMCLTFMIADMETCKQHQELRHRPEGLHTLRLRFNPSLRQQGRDDETILRAPGPPF